MNVYIYAYAHRDILMIIFIYTLYAVLYYIINSLYIIATK